MNFPITDSHLHFINNDDLHYPWLADAPLLNKSFLISDLMDATKALHVESFVFVQAECDPAQSLQEVEMVSELAKHDARIRGIVAQAPLEIGAEVYQHLAILKRNPLVKGVRRLLQSENMDFCLQKNFLDGLKMLPEFNFSFDVCIKEHQLPSVIGMVEQCPEIKFILDHLGKPNVVSKQLQPWKDNLSKLAAFPNVWCKISGLITEANHHTWCSEDLKPYLFHAIEVFGMNRVMFGSDWPVVNLAGSYSHWVHTLNDLLMHSGEKDWKKLFYENAQQCYSLTSAVAEV